MRIFAPMPWAMQQVFSVFGGSNHRISLVGGGGKSTLMYFLAEKCAGKGKKVLLSTTTHIYMPSQPPYAQTMEQVLALWQQGMFAVIGTPVPEKGKLAAPSQPFLRDAMALADVVLLESDGSKHYPCKVPKTGEPVLHPDSDMVLAVFGLSAIGRPLEEVCFRLEEAMALLDVAQDHILTAWDAARMIASPMGGRKDVGTRQFGVVLNQCDDGARRRAATEIAMHLAAMGVTDVVMTAFDPQERVFYQSLAKQ